MTTQAITEYTRLHRTMNNIKLLCRTIPEYVGLSKLGEREVLKNANDYGGVSVF